MTSELLHTALALLCLAVAIFLGRALATVLRQPPVVGEIAVGLLAGPMVVAFVERRFAVELISQDALRVLGTVGHLGLALFLVQVMVELRSAERVWGRPIRLVALFGFAPAFAVGALFGLCLLLLGGAQVRGSAPAVAFVLLIAVSLSVTAVPALARILHSRKDDAGTAGPLAMAAALVTDVVAWPVLAVALALSSSNAAVVLIAFATLGGGALAALVARRMLARPLERLAGRSPVLLALAVATAAYFGGEATAAAGLTSVLGPVLVGVVVPRAHGTSWAHVVDRVGRIGSWLVPAFFVHAGLSVFTGSTTKHLWWLTSVVLVVAVAVKIGGGYLGARLAGEPVRVALRVAVLLNTRGLTEIVVLQAGYEAGIITDSVYISFVIMAMATTFMTGPLLSLFSGDQAPLSSRLTVVDRVRSNHDRLN